MRQDARGHPLADGGEQREAAAALPRGCCDRLRRAVGEADGADPLEPGPACEVPRAGLRRPGRRPERGARPEPAPRHRHGAGACATHAEPHSALGVLCRRQALDRHAIEEVTLRTGAGADPDHAAGDVRVLDLFGEHRRPHPLGAPVGGGDAGGKQRQSRQPEGRRGVAAQQQRGQREDPGCRRRGPGGWLDRQSEIEATAGAEEHRHPEEEALALGGPHRAHMPA